MEIIHNSNKKTRLHQKANGIMAAIVLIAVGLIFLGKNLGFIESYIFRILISWQMLLIVIGLWSVVRQQLSGGLILLAVGTFFLIPHIAGINGGWIRTYWPILLIALGIILIVKKIFPQNNVRYHKSHNFKEVNQPDNGYVHSDNMFGSVKHIVLDPAFKGASIKNSFAGTIIDLRNTKLDADETFIDVDSLFGGIEVYAPNGWNIVSEVRSVFGGYDDKRYKESTEIDYRHKLIFRGSLTFSGLEVKS